MTGPKYSGGAVVVVGAQWGDEGKGKIVDLFGEHADVVARYGGGANAGHTLVVGGEKRVFHLIPSGVLHAHSRCVLGHGTVIDPAVLLKEVDALDKSGIGVSGRLLVSERAHVVLAHHMLVDGLRDVQHGIGTTKRGIGPAYQDKAARRGVRIGDLLRAERLRTRLHENLESWRPVIESLGGEVPPLDAALETLLAQGERLRPFVGDASRELSASIARGEKVLFEGAQGTMLDVDLGTYPFVTSSAVVSGGASTGAGVSPRSIGRVIGITKAYTTRVGGGPFPTELHGAEGDALRQAGSEFGATTGRPRRCGWLDIPALRYAVRVNGLGGLAMTKLDVLSGRKTLPLCVAYELDGKLLDEPPYDHEDLGRVTPKYEELAGWSEDISACKRAEDLPAATRKYIARIEALVGCPVTTTSVGPDRAQTFGENNPFR